MTCLWFVSPQPRGTQPNPWASCSFPTAGMSLEPENSGSLSLLFFPLLTLTLGYIKKSLESKQEIAKKFHFYYSGWLLKNHCITAYLFDDESITFS